MNGGYRSRPEVIYEDRDIEMETKKLSYRIVKKHNPHEEPDYKYKFLIQKRKTFLGISYWLTVNWAYSEDVAHRSLQRYKAKIKAKKEPKIKQPDEIVYEE